MAVTTVRFPPPRPEPPEPDMDWYMSVSQKRGVSPRCPFASVDRCPRYYQSLSLLGRAGSTKIPQDEDDRLKARWEKSDLWPRTGEYATSMFGNGEKHFAFSNFCPEVIYDRFRIFASDLTDHVDETDRDIAHRQLVAKSIPLESWQWAWSSIKPRHFTECPLYSPLAHSPEDSKGDQKELVTLKPTFMGMSMDVKELARRFRPWLQKWWGKQP